MKNIRKTGLLVLFLLSVNLAKAQYGTIQGVLTDSENSEALIGSNVFIEGTTFGTATDLEGNFKIERILPGTYQLNITSLGYKAEVIQNVVVKENQITIINKKLSVDAKELKGANISATRITNTENAVLAEMRRAEQVTNGVSSQQISKTQDRSATDVMRRIPGISIVEDRFVMIRGLSERYNVVMLNDAVAPSVEADKKAFSFDLLPSALIDRIVVYKTGAPELPGDFAGGAIKVFTKNIPDENVTQAGYSISLRAGTTFRNFYQSPSGRFDWLGMDGGERSLPDYFPQSLNNYKGEQLASYGKSLPNSWLPEKQTALPDHRFNILIARSMKLGKIKAGCITSLTYATVKETRYRALANFESFDEKTGNTSTSYIYNDTLCAQKVNVGIIHNWSFAVGEHSNIKFYNFFNQAGINQSLIREGDNEDAGSRFRNFGSRYNQRAIYSGQLAGSHDLFEGKTKVEWLAGVNLGNTVEPDYRRFQSVRSINAAATDPYYLVVPSSASLESLGRFYSKMHEDALSGALNIEQNLSFNDGKFNPKMKAGFYYERKNREFDARWMSYKKANIDNFNTTLLSMPVNVALSPENINSTTGFKLEEGTNPFDSYNNFSEIIAGYVGTSIPVAKKISFTGGVRFESSIQEQDTKDILKQPFQTKVDADKFLLSANLSYNITNKTLIRAAFFQSLNRPEFREIEYFSYYDFIYNFSLQGNTKLKVASINNAELRWEFYPHQGEMITAGVFYKEFKNPIERYTQPGSGGGTLNFYYDNAIASTSTGAEIEVRKSFEPIFIKGFLSKLSVAVNASVIDSKVNLGDVKGNEENNRPMMGQSPYMINAGIFYNDFDAKWQFNMLYNIFGKRLYSIGGKGLPDIYELPRHLVDFSATKQIGKRLEIKFGVKDILNNKFRFSQDNNQNGKFDGDSEVNQGYKPGSYYTVGVTVKY